jgi:dCMP deaminase
MNAIFNKNCEDLSDCIIYTILFPCNQCAKTIIQSGISEVVYMCDKNMNKKEAIAALEMFKAAKVLYRYRLY